MSDITLDSLLGDIYYEIEKKNKQSDLSSIPASDQLFAHFIKKYRLDSEKIPELFEILRNSHKIFTFPIVKEDEQNNVREVAGFVLADLVIVKSLSGYFEKQLMRIYSEVININLPISKIKKSFPAISWDYNNTELGKIGNIVINLTTFEDILSRDYAYARESRQYSPEWKEKMYKKLIISSQTVSYYIQTREEAPPEPVKEQKKSDEAKPADKIRVKRDEPSKPQSDTSIERNVLLYGIDLFTRICFRDYKFSLIQKVIDNNLVKTRDDLLAVKNHLKMLRQNSDKDLNLQKFAAEINRLEKSVNDRLK